VPGSGLWFDLSRLTEGARLCSWGLGGKREATGACPGTSSFHPQRDSDDLTKGQMVVPDERDLWDSDPLKMVGRTAVLGRGFGPRFRAANSISSCQGIFSLFLDQSSNYA
jgi:hypothetical protein